MSLHVYLTVPHPDRLLQPRQTIFVQREGKTVEISRGEWDSINPGIEPIMAMVNPDRGDAEAVFSQNITHNLNKMAMAVGIYGVVWCPDENDITKAVQLIRPLVDGIARMKADPGKYRQYDAPNGWGIYDGFVPWLEKYLLACRENPDASVSVSR